MSAWCTSMSAAVGATIAIALRPPRLAADSTKRSAMATQSMAPTLAAVSRHGTSGCISACSSQQQPSPTKGCGSEVRLASRQAAAGEMRLLGLSASAAATASPSGRLWMMSAAVTSRLTCASRGGAGAGGWRRLWW